MVIHRNEWLDVAVGAVVLAAAVGFIVYAMGVVGGLDRAGQGTNTYRVSLVEARGVSSGTDVRVAGVKVGRVDWVKLNPQTFAAETEIVLEDAFAFPADSVAVVASEGFLGGRFIEIVPGSSDAVLQPGARLRTMVPETSLVDLLLQSLNGRR